MTTMDREYTLATIMHCETCACGDMKPELHKTVQPPHFLQLNDLELVTSNVHGFNLG
jgi:hypothetical protein